ncbi:EamA family transporter [Neiella sp. HB171785]|uniref:EamA family transporter n=2 Tax=Neiella TaxID=1434025 RepID=A0A8J6QTF6_9GAMM|nr:MULTISPECIES: EamA family transporter [Neiella]MBD1390574.1 EamA family transporter [Neiella litorisoli]GGA84173.1 transporter [Neiella marina]
MTYLTFGLILFSVFLSVVAQIFLKSGMSNKATLDAFGNGFISGIVAVSMNLWVVFGMMAYVASAGVWLMVLSKVEVSRAYPFVGLGFIGTMLFGFWFLNEPLTLNKVIGTLCICTGVYFIAK